MKVLTVVGARPQFIKAAVVSRVLRENNDEILVHTGQHYDYNMSEQFFRELEIPKPDYNLGISGGSHAKMTARMLEGLEAVMEEEKPDCLLVYGDTNSTLAAALTAAKLHIPICHVEAGCRTHRITNPEEINRICTDHISSLLLACTQSGMDSIEEEGLSSRAVLAGDPMFDAFEAYKGKRTASEVNLVSLENGQTLPIPERFYYMTCHREENTADDSALTEILGAMDSLDAAVIYPVHPRNKERARRLKDKCGFSKVLLTEPVGYLDSIYLLSHAEKVVTDSGGLQREAFFAGKKCVTVLDFVTWPETMVDFRNELAKPIKGDILEKISHEQVINRDYKPFGDGHSAFRIVREMERVEWLTRKDF